MQTQRDHVHAHEFQMGRMSSALLLGDPTQPDSPSKRTVMGIVIGVIVGLLTAAGFGVYGFLVPGGSKEWRTPGVIIQEKGTVNEYVYVGGRLHRTLNHASALLISGGNGTVSVSAKSLAGVPRGRPVGLIGAPQLVPAAGQISTGPWQVCTSGGEAAVSLGSTAVAPMNDNAFLLVSAGSQTYLLWRQHRMLVADTAVPVALGAASALPVPVPPDWLRELPDGGQVSIPKMPGQGSPGARVAGRPATIGRLFRLGGDGSDQLFVLRQDGLAPVNRTAFELLQAVSHGAPVTLNAAELVAAPRSRDRTLLDMFPGLDAATPVSPAGKILCQRQAFVGNRMESTIAIVEPAAMDAAPPGRGLLAYAMDKSAAAGNPVLFLITDDGVRYRLSNSRTRDALGLGQAPAVPISRYVLDLFPAGPDLNRDAINLARQG
ncbi:type VII secretion protein EccB [Actinoplanes sp. NPDC051470]|uniref:type VII secretion protein EccB n=1 Tax=Actinoplanes sp. NPDC051470 TaxID=3157224 RepID=UPI003442F265